VSPWSFFFSPLFIIIFKEREDREREIKKGKIKRHKRCIKASIIIPSVP